MEAMRLNVAKASKFMQKESAMDELKKLEAEKLQLEASIEEQNHGEDEAGVVLRMLLEKSKQLNELEKHARMMANLSEHKGEWLVIIYVRGE